MHLGKDEEEFREYLLRSEIRSAAFYHKAKKKKDRRNFFFLFVFLCLILFFLWRRWIYL